MNSKIKPLIVLLLSLLAHSADAVAQQRKTVRQMEEIVRVYEALDSLFPCSDYVTLKPGEAAYWVNRTMRPEYDFLGACDKIKPLIEQMNALPCIGQKILREGADTPAEGYVFACSPSFNDDEQTNYVELVFNRNTIHFLYTSSLKGVHSPLEANDGIAAEMDSLFRQYTSRQGTSKSGIVYDGPAYQYQLVTFTNPQKVSQRAEGTVYTVPGCTAQDWRLISGKMKGYAIAENVEVAWNDVYRDYESVEILIDRLSTVPVVFAAAYKDYTLKLLRLEGTENHNIVLPRVWSEDSPVFNPKKNKDRF